jgi:nucleoside-diphosphate-sugar epimerase
MSTAFVTGGTGFLGRHIIDNLVAEGWDVIALHRSNSNIDHLRKIRVKLVEGAITDLASIESVIPDEIDAVFHVAGNTNMWSLMNDQQTQDNVDGTRNVVTVALEKRVNRFVYTSTIATFGFHPECIAEETQSNSSDSWINYFRSKWEAEQEVKSGISRGLDAVMLNPSNIIGPYDYKNWSQMFLMVKQNKLPALPSGEASFCHAQEVGKAHVAAYHKGRSGHNYLLGGVDATYSEVFHEIGKMLNRPVPDRVLPTWLMNVIGRFYLLVSYVTRKEPNLTPEKIALTSGRLVCSSEKANRELNYQPVSLEGMLRDCYDWMVSENLI